MLPPAANGTRSLIGRSGQFCAFAGPATARVERTAKVAPRKRRRGAKVRWIFMATPYCGPGLIRNGGTGADPNPQSCRGGACVHFAGLSWPTIERQAHHHRCAGAEGRADAHDAAMQLDQRLGDRQAQPRAVMSLGELALDLLERPAELLQRIARDTDSGILDAYDRAAARQAAAHRNASFLGGEFDRIGQKIERDLFERA